MNTEISKKNHIPILDGLRFLAAFTVLAAHYSFWVLKDQGIQSRIQTIIGNLSGLGMPLFFVLSGFVIHYNYYNLYSKFRGVKSYLVARFTRLFPLFFVLFTIEFFIILHRNAGAFSQLGSRWGSLLALPYYLTLTQDWVYGIIGHNNLIYQYGMVSSVSWSISLEFFFYLSYLWIAKWLISFKSPAKQIFLIISLQLALVFCLLIINRFNHVVEHVALAGFGSYATCAHGYQDSLLRWLYYFNPIVNLPAFLFGALTANIYLSLKNHSLSSFEKKYGKQIALLSICLVLATHGILYEYFASLYSFIGYTSSLLITPLIALLIFALVRYPSSIPTKILSLPLFTKLGAASYSTYLLHAFFCFTSRKFYHLHLNPWLLYVLSILSILILSRLSYLLFERTAQRWLRDKLIGEFKEQAYEPIPLFDKSAF